MNIFAASGNNLKYFPYIHNEKEHLYNPDFYLPDYNIYVEVKGYYADKDLAKWKYFTEKLYVLKAAEIDAINKDKFTLYEMILQKQSGNYVYKSLNVIK